jgi:hypothetical protein
MARPMPRVEPVMKARSPASSRPGLEEGALAAVGVSSLSRRLSVLEPGSAGSACCPSSSSSSTTSYHLRRDLRKGLQDEGALVHGRMRHHQPGFIQDGIAIKQQIEIDGARAVAFIANPAQAAFDIQQHAQQLRGWQVGLHLGHPVEVLPLPRWSTHRVVFEI